MSRPESECMKAFKASSVHPTCDGPLAGFVAAWDDQQAKIDEVEGIADMCRADMAKVVDGLQEKIARLEAALRVRINPCLDRCPGCDRFIDNTCMVHAESCPHFATEAALTTDNQEAPDA